MKKADPTAVHSVRNLQRMQMRHWKYGNVTAFNRFREFLYSLEEKQRNVRDERFAAKIKKRPQIEAKPKILHYSLPLDNAGRETVVIHDAFDRRHVFSL
ncbi:MAG: hypothetical protein QMC36_01185 [Patescibacteria group bacterium]